MSIQLEVHGDRSVVVGRDAICSIINTGDHNQFFVGDYERLRDAYIEPWSVFERLDIHHFVGRQWLLAEIDAFLHNNDRGYFILEADAGLGKTTFLAWLTRERKYIHHFIELAPGLEGVGRGLKNLAAQVVLAYHLSAYEAEGVLPGAANRSDYLHNLLKQAAEKLRKDEKIVLVIDALDEGGTLPNQNVLGLPEILPKGIFIIVSQRPVPVALNVDTTKTPRHPFLLTSGSPENINDMRRFLKQAATWPGISNALQESNYTSEQFITTLLKKCRGVWIYLHFVIHEIERGERSPLNMDDLPDGMTLYYIRYWRRWRDKDEDQWYQIYLPLLATLAAAQEAASIELLTEWVSLKIPVQQLRRLFNEYWRPFLAINEKNDQAGYRFYHATMNEFFNGQVEINNLTAAEVALVDELATATHKAHSRIADRYLVAWGNLEAKLPRLKNVAQRDMDDGYGLSYLVAHLGASERIDDLHHLLALENNDKRNTWFEAKQAKADTSGYLTDVYLAWRLTEEAFQRGRLDAALIIGLQYRYALITASITSLARNLPPTLLAALVREGIFTPEQGIAYVRQIPESELRAKALGELAPYLPEPLIKQALIVVRDVNDDSARALALAKIAVYLHGSLKEQALKEVKTALEDGMIAFHLVAPYLPGPMLHKALTIARANKTPRVRQEKLASLMPYLKEPFRSKVQVERLAAALAINDKNDKADAISKLVTDVEEPPKSSLLRQALTAVVKSPGFKSTGLRRLAPYMPLPMLHEALAEARSIRDQYYRGSVLIGLAPYFPSPIKEKILKEVQRMARTICYNDTVHHPVELAKAEMLADLAPLLPEPLREEVLCEGLAAVESIRRELGPPDIHKSEAIEVLAPHLYGTNLLKALDIARNLEVESYRIDSLMALVPNLPQALQNEVFHEMLMAVQCIRVSRVRTDKFEKILAILPKEMHPDAFMAAQVINDGNELALTMVQLAQYRPNLFIDEALSAAEANCREFELAKSIITLAPHFPESQRLSLAKKALAIEQDIKEWDTPDGIKVLVSVVALAPELLPQVVEVVRGFLLWDSRADALVMIASHVNESHRGELLREALAAIQAKTSSESRNLSLKNIAVTLAEYRYTREALSAIKAIEDEEIMARAFVRIAPNLPELVIVDILKEAEKIEKDEYRVDAVTGLAPFLPESIRSENLQRWLVETKKISSGQKRALSLSRLVPYLAEPTKGKALREALKAASGNFVLPTPQIETLKLLAPYLSGDILEKALEIAREIKEYEWKCRIQALLALAERFPLQKRNEILIEALDNAIRGDGELLETVALRLTNLPLNILYQVWCNTIKKLASRTRKDLLTDLRALMPIIVAMGGKQVLPVIFNALQDVSRWWS